MVNFRMVFTQRRASAANAAVLDKAVFEKQCILCEYRTIDVRIAVDKVRPVHG